MNSDSALPFSESQMDALRRLIHQGASDASEALSKWIHLPSVISVDALDVLPLSRATEVLGTGGEPICFCAMGMTGMLCGQLVFAFDEASGLALADLILDRSDGSQREWGEVEASAALETANIIGCAYLNALQKGLADRLPDTELLPSPPVFQRDYAECLLEFALTSQMTQSDIVMLTEARFEVAETNLDWTLLLVPDGSSIDRLREVLPG